MTAEQEGFNATTLTVKFRVKYCLLYKRKTKLIEIYNRSEKRLFNDLAMEKTYLLLAYLSHSLCWMSDKFNNSSYFIQIYSNEF